MVETLKPSLIDSKHVKKTFLQRAKTFTKKTIASLALAGTLISCSNYECEFYDMGPENKVEQNEFSSRKDNGEEVYELIKSYVKEENDLPKYEKTQCYTDDFEYFVFNSPYPKNNEKALSLFNKIMFTYPDIEGYKELAEAYLIDTYFCYSKVKETLGIDLLPIRTNIIKGHIITERNFDATAYANFNGIYFPFEENHDPETKQYYIDKVKRNIEKNVCYPIVAHELTHLFTFSLPNTRWLNEGISVYMEYVHGPNGKKGLENMCLEDIVAPNWNMGTFEHLNLGEPQNPEIPSKYYYLTAACFWYDLEKKYGINTVSTVYKELEKYQTREPSELNGLKKLHYLRIFEDALGPLPDDLLEKYGLTNKDDKYSNNPTYEL